MVEIERRIELAMPSPRKLFTPAVSVVLVLMVIGWTLISYAPGLALNYLAISLQSILHGRIWQFLTYPFINGCGWSLVFNGLLVLFIGSAVEREWRTGSFVLLWLIVSVVCGLVWIIIGTLFGGSPIGMGTDSCGYGLIAAFGLLYYRRRFIGLFWTVEAQYIAWGLIVIGIILGIPRPITWIWVLGALVAYLYIKLRWRISSAEKTVAAGRYGPKGFVDID